MGIDIAQKMSDVMPIYLGIVVLLSLIVLTIVFRSIIVPLKATAGFLLTILATLGATTAVFQWGWLNSLFGLDSTGPVMALLPILVTGIAYGLAMDYQVFLVSSMRESLGARAQRPRVGDRRLHHSSRVVVAAAVIMTAVFAGFIFNGDPMIKQIGFALAIAIAIDAFLGAHDARPGADGHVRRPRLAPAARGSTGCCPTSTSRATSCSSASAPRRSSPPRGTGRAVTERPFRGRKRTRVTALRRPRGRAACER